MPINQHNLSFFTYVKNHSFAPWLLRLRAYHSTQENLLTFHNKKTGPQRPLCIGVYTQKNKKSEAFPPFAREEKEEKESSLEIKEILKVKEKTKNKKIKNKKLVYDLHDKDQYCIYSEYLKFFVSV